MVSVEALPVELISLIFSFIDDTATRISCSSTCKKFRKAIDGFHFSTIKIPDQDGLLLLARTFLEVPRLAAHVKHLDLLAAQAYRRPPTSLQILNRKQLVDIRDKIAKNLESLSNDDCSWNVEKQLDNISETSSTAANDAAAAAYVLLSTTNLESLVFSCDLMPNQFEFLILQQANAIQRRLRSETQPALRNLGELHIATGFELVYLCPIMELPSLRKITGNGVQLDGMAAVASMELRNHSHITELYLENVQANTQTWPLNMQCFPHLKVFDFQYHNFGPHHRLHPGSIFDSLIPLRHTLEQLAIVNLSPRPMAELNGPLQPLATLQDFTKLTSLHLCAYYLDHLFHNPLRPDVAPHVFRFSILPACLEDLTLSDVGDGAPILLRVFADDDLVLTLPELVSLHIEFSWTVWRDYKNVESRCLELYPEFQRLGVTLTIDTHCPATHAARQRRY